MIIRSVNTAEIRIDTAPTVLEARGVGSCVVVCLYDKKNRRGGMAHVMLPNKLGADEVNVSGGGSSSIAVTIQDAPSAVEYLVSEMEREGSSVKGLQATVAGGSEMFKSLGSRPPEERLGVRNSSAVKEALGKYGIKIVSSDLGGNTGRSVRFYLEDGKIDIEKKK